jgi:hypothetical protein
MVDYLFVLFVREGIKTSASTHHSIACRNGKEYGRKLWKLTVAKKKKK